MNTNKAVTAINPYAAPHLPADGTGSLGRATTIVLAVLWMLLGIPTGAVIGLMVLFLVGCTIGGLFDGMLALPILLAAYAASVATVFGMWLHGIHILCGKE